MFPAVNLQADRLITDENGIYTNGGAWSFLNLVLYLVEKYFDRRFIKATGNTPVEYTQRVKMEAVKKALETSRKSINEIMYEVGYSDVKAFREVFRKITGMSPLDYGNRYNKEAMAAY